MKRLVSSLFLPILAAVVSPSRDGQPANSPGMLFIANQFDHTANLVDLATRKPMAKIGVDVNGHEVVVSPDHKWGFVPIYGNSGVGKPGTDGATVEVVDLKAARAKREAHDGKQLPSVGTGSENGKTTISSSNEPTMHAHIEYSAHDNPRIP